MTESENPMPMTLKQANFIASKIGGFVVAMPEPMQFKRCPNDGCPQFIPSMQEGQCSACDALQSDNEREYHENQ